ncbi:synaptic vesicle 2-related protein-like [Limulus polyphemus]|uniref:Synaptic vesicle 2-related protein-like n=1 Tax=Limulus polyphemus TaxID=6850 RepID=A0ABM1SQC0_LIMPO|nr:synaptic vesicle 2-related protein-like [Limulus polyphemus]
MNRTFSNSSNDNLSLLQNGGTELRASSETASYTYGENGSHHHQESYTIEEAVNAVGFGKFQWKLTFVSSLAWMAEACEVMILSLLGRFLSCEWLITSFEVALLSSVVFIAIAFGSLIIGKLEDIYGRKKVIISCSCMLIVFGILSAVSPSIKWMFVFRGFLGLFVHGLQSAMVLYMEYLPTNKRGQAAMSLAIFWGIGSLLVIVVAMAVMTTINSWRTVLLIIVVPIVVFLFFSMWYPESARYLLVCGKKKEAAKSLSKMAEENGKPLPTGNLVLPPSGLQHGSIINLVKQQKSLFLILCYAWVSLMFTYYGITILTPEIIMYDGLAFNGEERQNHSANNITSDKYIQCRPYLISEYLEILWTTAAELPGIFASYFLVERFSRRRLMCMMLLVYIACTLSLLIDNLPAAVLLLVLFVDRGAIAGCFQILLVYTIEAYPTTNRALAFGFYSSFGRIGAILTPFVAQLLVEVQPKLAGGIYALAAFLVAISIFFLPFDTKGKELQEH